MDGDLTLEEIVAYAKRLGAVHVGIACCVGTQREARLVVSFFGSNDRLATALAQQDLVLIGAPNIGWKIGRAEDRDRISQPTWLGAEFVPPPPPPAAEPAYPETILVQ